MPDNRTSSDVADHREEVLRVLIIEDSPQDAELEVATLRRAGYLVRHQVAPTEDTFRQFLSQGDFDIILADFNLQNWTGLDALDILKKSGKDIPVVIVTGSLGDETAVDCIKEGAADYVLKDRLARLPLAVRRALKEKELLKERAEAQKALRQSEEQFRLISENVDDLIAVLDLEGKRLYNSPSYRRILGDPQKLCGTVSFNEIHPEDREKIKTVFQETVRTGVGKRAEFRFLTAEGAIRHIESQGSVIRDRSGKPSRVVLVSRDITERKSLENQLVQSQKMEAVGRLAGGVAHDFNNLLTVIMGFTEVLREQLRPDDPGRSHADEILKASGRAAMLTRQLLAFSRKQVLAPQVLSLNTVVEELEKMLGRLIGEDIELRSNFSQGLGLIKADPGQIEQIILNLCVNARDAMPNGGKLTIETADVDLDQSFAHRHMNVTPGPYVMLAVSDTGIGMDSETQSHIFEPFFTTKQEGKGTGLGLATVYGIVKQSSGSIWVYSEPGQGTTFKVYFPRVDEISKVEETAKAPPALRVGDETILLVEDEEAVRGLAKMVLQKKGFTVLEARHGEEALLLAKKHAGPVHLLVTDIVMPGINGREVADRIGNVHPEAKVLFLSGYTGEAVIHHGVLESGVAFLQKPFTPDTLVRKVREVLDQAA